MLSTVGAGVISTIECEANVLDFAFVDEYTLAVGGDDKVVSLWDCQTARAGCIARGVPFPNRIKAVKAFRMGGVQYVAAATCEGTVAIYDMVSLQAAGAKALKAGKAAAGSKPLWSYTAPMRLTCMEAVDDFEGENDDVKISDDAAVMAGSKELQKEEEEEEEEEKEAEADEDEDEDDDDGSTSSDDDSDTSGGDVEEAEAKRSNKKRKT